MCGHLVCDNRSGEPSLDYLHPARAKAPMEARVHSANFPSAGDPTRTLAAREHHLVRPAFPVAP
jgi:hypothetical protein